MSWSGPARGNSIITPTWNLDINVSWLAEDASWHDKRINPSEKDIKKLQITGLIGPMKELELGGHHGKMLA